MSAWQPIETAPKDGTLILTFSADAAAAPMTDPFGNPGTSMMVMRWLPYGGGKFDPVDEAGDFWTNHYDPTHWQPLPEPPEAR